MSRKSWLDRRSFRQWCEGVLFLLPNISGFILFTTVPLAVSLFMAFTDWNLEMHNIFQHQPVRMVGFDNFIKLFRDPDFFTYLVNTLFLMLGIPFGIAGSLGAALLLNNNFRSGSRRVFWIVLLTAVTTILMLLLMVLGMGGSALMLLITGICGAIFIGGTCGGSTVYRTLFYFPSFTSGVAVYILWKKLYSPQNGPINNFLQPLLDFLSPFLGKMSPALAGKIAVALVLLMILLYFRCIIARFRIWSMGDFGTGSLILSLGILSIPLLCLNFWCSVSWGKIAGCAGVIAGIIAMVRVLFRKRLYHCPFDYGMSDAVIISGVWMIALFIILGLNQIIVEIPAAVQSAEGLMAPLWLSDYYWAKPAIMIMGFWGAIGSNNMLLYLAGLSGISPDLYEAANIDGATAGQRFWHITWPQLANVTFFILIMSVMGGLQGGFEMAKSMTNGGPAGATTTLAYYIYTEGFDTGRLGYASAVAWTLFAMVFAVTIFNWKFGNRYTND